MEIKNRPNPNEAFPNPKIPSLCFIKNVVKSPRIIIGDRLIIGKFCAIAKGVEFVMIIC